MKLIESEKDSLQAVLIWKPIHQSFDSNYIGFQFFYATKKNIGDHYVTFRPLT